ncbi:MAG TPA: 2-C-methyl-D-erythritol 2,4-cyclodiphosphate synthase [Gemmatimonadales bacterium]|nr:2-C-methyl-D-erythritol 2,4-cyclodiphosphate synthase [Gemmatimonadales bacterium]
MIRVGIGYDSHRFAPGRPLVLGGVRIPFELGLAGHSDADAVAHALIDAMLGAAALGNIGQHFPDDDPAYRDADSIALLRRAHALVQEAGWRLAHADLTLIVERPRLGPHLPAMVGCLTSALGVEAACLSIKPKTNEGMGFIGRGEGIAVIAVATLEGR